MRALMIATGLCVAATAASAAELELVTRTDTNLTLNNGCVYAPNQFAQDETWTFVYGNANAGSTCPLAQPSAAWPKRRSVRCVRPSGRVTRSF